MSALKVAGCVLLLFVVNIATGEEQHRSTMAENTAIKGPAHTQRFTSRKLAPDPRVNPGLYVWSPQQWMVFDREGNNIEYANSFTPDGKPEFLVRQKYDEYGDLIESITTNAQGIVTARSTTESRCTNDGRDDFSFFNGKMVSRNEQVLDERSYLAHSRQFNSDGKLELEIFKEHDEAGHLTDYKAVGSNFFVHTRDRYGSDGIISERQEFDAAGKLVHSYSFNDGELTSWWQDPECHCSTQIGLTNSKKGISKTWTIQPDGTLDVTVQKHPGRPGNLQNTEMERYSNGSLVEKLTFEYEEDRYGSWTKRKVFAWDPQTNTMVQIQEDTRLIEYYQ